MARWDPGASDRLRKAAWDLCLERGYDELTVSQIAERAGLTRRSFSRYFSDKREVLFAGSEQLAAAAAAAMLAADHDVPPLAVMLEALAMVGARMVEQVDHAAQSRAVIAASAELQERERTKLAALSTAIAGALRQRGIEPGTALPLAQAGTIIFQNAFDRWIDDDAHAGFEPCLRTVAATLSNALTPGPHT
jgi:AcrR family transcriptional regulator